MKKNPFLKYTQGFDLTFEQATEDDFRRFGNALLTFSRDHLHCFETSAQYWTQQIFTHIIDADGNPIFGLVRVFRITDYDTLPTTLKDLASADVPYWVTLMGTYGIEDQWRKRDSSQGHQVFPADSAFTPMLKAAFTQMNLKPGETLDEQDARLEFAGTTVFNRYFHVETAENSPYLPAQDEFITPYKIQSVFGVGSPFLSGSSFMLLMFSRIPLPEETLSKLNTLTSYIATSLAIYDGQDLIWE